MSELPLIATVAQVAAFIGWTEGKLRNRIQDKKGHPPYVRNGRSIEFRRDDVLAWYALLETVEPEDAKRQTVPRRSVRSIGAWPIRADRPATAR